MAEWSEWIGNSANLQAKSVSDNLGKEFKFALLARRDGIHTDLTDQYGDDYEDPYFKYETLEQLNNPKSKDDKPPYYTYECDELVPVKKDGKSVKEKDPETGKMVVKKRKDKGPHKVKTFATIGGDLKLFFQFLLNKYMEEAYQCYLHHNKSFSESDQVLSQIRKFVDNQYGMPSITNFIVDVVDTIPVDEFVDEDEIPTINKNDTLAEYLIKQSKITFKDDKGQTPNIPLKVIIEKFIDFLNLTAVMYMDSNWDKPLGTLHIGPILGMIRVMYVMLRGQGHEFPEGTYKTAVQWVEESIENAKKLREENVGKKKTTTKKPAAKRKTTTRKTKKKEETPDSAEDEDEGSDDENGDDVDKAMEELEEEEEGSDEDPEQEDIEYESEPDFDD